MRKLALLGIALTLGSCQAAGDMDAAEKQVAAFHRAYDAGNYGAIWDGSAPAMKQVTTRQQLVGLMDTFGHRLGPVKSTTRTGFNVNYATGGSQVTLVYQTEFANGEATETFVYDTSDPPRLLGWHFEVPSLPAMPAPPRGQKTARPAP
jgi:hypothetical protein